VRMSIRNLLAPLAGAMLFGTMVYARRIGPQAVQVRPITLILPRLSPTFDGYRIVQISDIHISQWMMPERLAALIPRINEQQPDLVAITGDLLTNGQPYDPEALSGVLRLLRPRDAVVAVLGNHDYRNKTGVAVLRRVLEESGIVELPNAAHTLRRGDSALHIAGVDSLSMRRARLDLVLPQVAGDDAAILLAHEPDFADVSAATGRFDLQLSGHTHGGQMILPGMRPPVLPRLGRRYPVGFYRLRGMYLYTNRGLGVGSIRVRLNCPPEITVFTLRAPRRD
jgi:predicted MPP superfamily phosphohydrolase